MKSSSPLKVYLITLFVNLIITFFIGFKYKDVLVAFLSPTIYYQGIVFISLSLPLLITWIHEIFNKANFSRKLKKFKKKAPNIDKESLDEVSKEMFDKLTKQDQPTSYEIRELYEQMETMYK
ncbi:hypothetical protein [Pectobacterium polaris]|uniref:hypothetical protein n=1 Tax=Pectobacterium polaris TaxID=2042057 RepID=UPI0032E4FCDA